MLCGVLSRTPLKRPECNFCCAAIHPHGSSSISGGLDADLPWDGFSRSVHWRHSLFLS